jgi:hypothetical protein
MLFSELPKTLAYLDPGSGSMILQLILAALLGLGVFVRIQWRKIKSLFGRKNTNDDNDGDDEK